MVELHCKLCRLQVYDRLLYPIASIEKARVSHEGLRVRKVFTEVSEGLCMLPRRGGRTG